MYKADFHHIRYWVFDLDNTLYLPEVQLFAQIESLMGDYVMAYLSVDRACANRLRKRYWQRYGTTLAGLIAEHSIDPEPFLEHVHDIDFSGLSRDLILAQRIKALPGRKIVYTNGTVRYARQVLGGCGLQDAFDAVYGVESASYRSKPLRGAFEEVFASAGIEPELGAMFEDDERNLEIPFAMGMRTIHVAPKALTFRFGCEFITHRTDDLKAFLHGLAA